MVGAGAVVAAPDVVQKVSVGNMLVRRLERGPAVQVNFGDTVCEAVEGKEGRWHEEHNMEHEDKKGGSTADEGSERAPVAEWLQEISMHWV